MKKTLFLAAAVLVAVQMTGWAQIKTTFTTEVRQGTEKPTGFSMGDTEQIQNKTDVDVPKRTRGIERYPKTDIFGNSIPDSFLYYRALLNNRQQIVYDQLYMALMNYQTEVTLCTQVDKDEFNEVCDAVRLDNPEVFWWAGSYSWWVNSNGIVSQTELKYWTEGMDIQQLYDNFWAMTAPIVFYASTLKDDMSKIKYIHDYICLSTEYDYDAFNKNDVGGKLQTAYSCAVEYKTVCAGYSTCFQYYMQQLGIPCESVWSQTHQWNMIKVNNQYYQIDVTWDDTELIPSHYNLVHEEMGKIDLHKTVDLPEKLVKKYPSTGKDMTYTNYYGPLLLGSPYTYQELNNFYADIDHPETAKVCMTQPQLLPIVKSYDEFKKAFGKVLKNTSGNIVQYECCVITDDLEKTISSMIKGDDFGDFVFDTIDANGYKYSYGWNKINDYHVLSLELTLN